MKKHSIIGVLFILVVFLTIGCEKYNLKNKQEEILGTWIKTDNSDTLFFLDDTNLYRSGTSISDYYKYKLFADSIEIEYAGCFFVAVHPTKHKYSMNDNRLTIDFSNIYCFGFEKESMTFFKE